MSNSKWIGAALGLALCSTALASCSKAPSNDSGSAPAAPSGIALDDRAGKEIRDAIAKAPQHGLKPELFLKGGESGEALVQAALKYASALANGYSDPNKLFEVYTLPRAKTDVRAGLQQALQNNHVGQWLDSLAPQTEEYKALSQAFIHYAQLAGQSGQQQISNDRPIKPGARDERIPAIVAVLRAGGDYSEAPAAEPQQPGQNPRAAAPTTYTRELVA